MKTAAHGLAIGTLLDRSKSGRRRGQRADVWTRVRSMNPAIALLVVGLLVLAAVSTLEYTKIQALNDQVAGEQSQAEVVYNLQGVAIPVICCPDLASSIVVGQYLFKDSSISPVSAYRVNGTEYPGGNGVMLLFEVAPLSAPSDIENATFVWSASYNGSVPFPANSSIFGGMVEFHWYVLDGLLFMHVETA
jgi:hypothetical protein